MEAFCLQPSSLEVVEEKLGRKVPELDNMQKNFGEGASHFYTHFPGPRLKLQKGQRLQRSSCNLH